MRIRIRAGQKYADPDPKPWYIHESTFFYCIVVLFTILVAAAGRVIVKYLTALTSLKISITSLIRAYYYLVLSFTAMNDLHSVKTK